MVQGLISTSYHSRPACHRTSTDTGPFLFDSPQVLHPHNSSHACDNTYREEHMPLRLPLMKRHRGPSPVLSGFELFLHYVT